MFSDDQYRLFSPIKQPVLEVECPVPELFKTRADGQSAAAGLQTPPWGLFIYCVSPPSHALFMDQENPIARLRPTDVLFLLHGSTTPVERTTETRATLSWIGS